MSHAGRLNPLRWPLTVKAPLLVVVFMLAVSVGITNAVLARLKETQERNLASLSKVHLDGLAAAVLPHVLREDVWEVFDAIDRGAAIEPSIGRVSIVVVNAQGETIAASNPAAAPLGSRQDFWAQRFAGGDMISVDAGEGHAFGRRPLLYQGRAIGEIFAEYDVSHLLNERSEVLRTLIVTNAAIALLLAAVGYWTIRRMLSPLSLLSRRLDQSLLGPLQPIPSALAGAQTGEFARLFARYNAMAEALNERETLAKQLAEEERLASLGRLASGMAHEINNPLGGLFNAIDTLKTHGDKPAVRKASLDLIERGLRGIRDVVRSALATYRADREMRKLTAADIDDLRLLVQPEAGRKNIALAWRNRVAGAVALPASSIRQVLLNLVLNGLSASPPSGSVRALIESIDTTFRIEVEDEGAGFPAEAAAVLTGETLRPLSLGEGAGLGLWMTRRLVADLGGSIEIIPAPLRGSIVRVVIPVPQPEELRHVA